LPEKWLARRVANLSHAQRTHETLAHQGVSRAKASLSLSDDKVSAPPSRPVGAKYACCSSITQKQSFIGLRALCEGLIQHRIQSAQIPRYFTMKGWARGKIKAEGLGDQPTEYCRDWHDARVQVGRKAEEAVGIQVVREADFAAMLWRPATMKKTMTTG
jgi:hypothetical protein